jgi:hypothetical protein
MMKARLAFIAVTLGLLLSMNVEAASDQKLGSFSRSQHFAMKSMKSIKTGPRFFNPKSKGPTKAPEISAESAGVSIALLTGVLLLVSEGSRRRS